MSTNNQNLDNFFTNFGKSFADMDASVKNNEWSFKYDDLSDILYFSPRDKHVSVDSILVPAGETGIAARISSNGSIESIVIEDFGSVFVPENNDLKALYEKLTVQNHAVEATVARRVYALILSDFSTAVKSFQTAAAMA